MDDYFTQLLMFLECQESQSIPTIPGMLQLEKPLTNIDIQFYRTSEM